MKMIAKQSFSFWFYFVDHTIAFDAILSQDIRWFYFVDHAVDFQLR